jgi:hypothetical protein
MPLTPLRLNGIKIISGRNAATMQRNIFILEKYFLAAHPTLKCRNNAIIFSLPD